MTPHKTNSELLLIGLAALIFLLAALALFLLQDPQAPLPWEATATASPTRPAATTQPVAIGAILPTPTPRTSYTPFATLLTVLPPTSSPTISPTPDASAPSQTAAPTPTGTITPPPPPPPLFSRPPAPTPTNHPPPPPNPLPPPGGLP